MRIDGSAFRLPGWLLVLLLLGLGSSPGLASGETSHRPPESSRDHGDSHGHPEGEEGEDHGIELSPAQQAAAGITLGRADSGSVGRVLTLLGEVKLDQTRVVHVVPRVAGIATEVRAQMGDRVEVGESLAVLESPELGEAKIRYVSARLEDELARLELDRQAKVARNTQRLLKILAKDPSPSQLRIQARALEVGEDKGDLLEAYSRFVYARRNRDREKSLRRQEISSDQALQAAERDFEIAEARFHALEETIRFRYQLERTRAERKVQVADNQLHNARRRLLLLGVKPQAIEALTQVHAEESSHQSHGHELPQLSPEETLSLPKVQDLDRSLAEFELRTPLAGLVLRRHLTVGERVTPEDDPFLVGDLSRVWVDLSVSPQDLDSVAPGLWVEILSEGQSLRATSEVSFVQPILDETVRTGLVRVGLENPQGLWRPGQFVRGQVALEGPLAAVRIAKSAVIRDGDRTLAFVHEEGHFEPRVLKLGRVGVRWVEVLSGLEAKETYAATGAFVLKAELARETLGESGHSH